MDTQMGTHLRPDMDMGMDTDMDMAHSTVVSKMEPQQLEAGVSY